MTNNGEGLTEHGLENPTQEVTALIGDQRALRAIGADVGWATGINTALTPATEDGNASPLEQKTIDGVAGYVAPLDRTTAARRNAVRSRNATSARRAGRFSDLD